MTVYRLSIDHLVIAARTLEEGARFVSSRLGCDMTEGGAHVLMRTHNRLLNLWGGVYLEVIAIDPAAAHTEPPRPRLFSLDDPAMQKRLEAGPQLVHWVARMDRPKSLSRYQSQYPSRIPPVIEMARGDNKWHLSVADNGAFPAWQGAGDGLLPSLIQWESSRHPGTLLPETGIALKSLTGFHARAHLISEQLAWLGATHLMHVEVTDGPPGLVAEFELSDGLTVTIGEAPKAAETETKTDAAAVDETAKPIRKRAKAKKVDATLTDDNPDMAVTETSPANER